MYMSLSPCFYISIFFVSVVKYDKVRIKTHTHVYPMLYPFTLFYLDS